MELNFKTFGQGYPIVILHGLFGTLDNWQTVGKKLAEHYSVYLVDLRNHGRSPHAEELTYPLMAADVKDFLESQWIHEAYLIGHSMGGKVAMEVALTYPDLVKKLVVVDVAPKVYPGGHEEIFKALLAVDLAAAQSRNEVEESLLQSGITDTSIRQFLLKNLSRSKSGSFEWKMNLPVIHRHYPDILDTIHSTETFDKPTLFIRGGKSNYILDSDEPAIQQLFPQAKLETVAEAGHWVHAEASEELIALVLNFLSESDGAEL